MAAEEEEDIAQDGQTKYKEPWWWTATQNGTQMEVPDLQGRGEQQTMRRVKEGNI